MLRSKWAIGAALLGAWIAACSGKTNDFQCKTGNADCSCRADDSCADGLVCSSHHLCVKPEQASAGQANAGRSSGGATSRGGQGGSTNAAGQENAGDTGSGATGGTKSASGGTNGTSGDAGAAGEPGTETGGEPGQTTGGTGGVSGGSGATARGGARSRGGARNRGGASSGGAGAGSGAVGTGAQSGAGGFSGMNTVAGASGAGAVSGAGGAGGMSGNAGTSGVGGIAGSAGLGGASGSGGAGAVGGVGGLGGLGGAGGNGGASSCKEITLPSMMWLRDVSQSPDFVDYEYRINALGGSSPDYAYVDFYGPGVDPSYDGDKKGTFSLGTGTDANFETCARCVLAEQDSGAADDALFFASAGTMVIASGSDHMNGFPTVTLTDVTLVEVTIDDTTHVSTPVANGRCLHLTSGSMSFPSGWTCDPDYYAADDGCDCGCGVRDGDCANGTVNACEYCHCSGDAPDCSTTSVRSTNNALCQ